MCAFVVNAGHVPDNHLPSLIKMLKFTNKLIELVDEPAPHWTLVASHAGAGKKKPKTA